MNRKVKCPKCKNSNKLTITDAMIHLSTNRVEHHFDIDDRPSMMIELKIGTKNQISSKRFDTKCMPWQGVYLGMYCYECKIGWCLSIHDGSIKGMHISDEKDFRHGWNYELNTITRP